MTARPTGNLPVEMTSFVGRREDLIRARNLLGSTRLLTLTGVGGVGKTRLAAAVAGGVRRDFPDGVWLVALADLRQGGLLTQSICGHFGLSTDSPDAFGLLAEHLRTKRLLLVLDNCEHLVDACSDLVSRLLSAAGTIKVLATSRQALGVEGEQLLPVSPLTVRSPGGLGEAMLLFEERASAAEPDFEITDDDLVKVGALLLVAGHDTTTMMISLAMLTLLTDSEARARFAAGRSVNNEIEELLRFLTMVHFGLARRAATDFDFRGVPMKKDDLVVFSLIGANRDPRMYTNPDVLDFERGAFRHVAFGWGIHQCLGQNVARAELTSVLTKTLQRFPDLRLAVPLDEVPMHDKSTNYGVEKLWVAK